MLQAEHRGFMLPKRQSLKSRAELPTGNAALYKGRRAFQISTLMRFFERPGGFRWFNFITHPVFYQ
nr:MAG TPA: hypothetical protein [Caudoviricetes sp.]